MAISGTRGVASDTFSSASCIASAAGCISEQWKGALTGSSMPRLQPLASPPRSCARQRPCGRSPRPGRRHCRWRPRPLRPALLPCRPPGRAPARCPSSAAMAPTPTGTAFCIDCPRSFRSRAASASFSDPAAASAEYSPSEWPATWLARLPSGLPPSFSRIRITAMLTAIRAGWAFSVRTSSDSGPSRINLDRFCFRASSTSWNTSRAVPKASARSAPMPTAWDPCPGNTKARLMGRFPPFFGLMRPSQYPTRQGARNALISGDLPV